MKKLPIIIGIPVLALALVLGGAMVWRLKTQTVDTLTSPQQAPIPNSFTTTGGVKPTNSFSFLFGSQATPILTPVPTPESVAAMNAELNALGDDGGTSYINSLKDDASGL